jgi:hypothetical protein
MSAHRKILNDRPVTCLHVPDRKALDKARTIARQVAMLGDPLGQQIDDSITALLSQDEEPADGNLPAEPVVTEEAPVIDVPKGRRTRQVSFVEDDIPA